MTARSQLARLRTLESRMSSWPNKHLLDFTVANSCACWLQAPRTTSPAKLTAVKHLLVASFTMLPASSGGRQWNKPLHPCIIEVWNSGHCQPRATSANWLSCLARRAGGQVSSTYSLMLKIYNYAPALMLACRPEYQKLSQAEV